MSFSENMANVVAAQLARFVTLNRHQLAGQVANLDFWIDQVRHVLEVIDGYEPRFRRLKSAQDAFVTEYQIRTSSPFDPDIQSPPGPPSRIPYANLKKARHEVTEATYRFLVRLCHEGLIPESQLRAICSSLEIGVETSDLHRKNS